MDSLSQTLPITSSGLISVPSGRRTKGPRSGLKKELDLELKDLQDWLDSLPLTRWKKHVNRDFSDGVLLAELIASFFPKLIELHNYIPASGATGKKSNWELLNRKVLPKLGIKLPEQTIDGICTSKQGVIEPILIQIRKLITKKSIENAGGGDAPTPAPPTLTEASCHVNNSHGKQAEFVLYEGSKFVREELLLEREHENSELKGKVKELSGKVQRLEVLIDLKEAHLTDLTKQLRELRLRIGDADQSVCTIGV